MLFLFLLAIISFCIPVIQGSLAFSTALQMKQTTYIYIAHVTLDI